MTNFILFILGFSLFLGVGFQIGISHQKSQNDIEVATLENRADIAESLLELGKTWQCSEHSIAEIINSLPDPVIILCPDNGIEYQTTDEVVENVLIWFKERTN